jgi:hypothetical protein
LSAITSWITAPSFGVLGLVRDLTDTTRASTLDERISGTRAALERREALLIDIVGQHTEVLVEATCGVDVGTDTKAWTYTATLDWLEIIHFVRHILTIIQVINGLSKRETVRVWRNVLKVSHRLFWLEAPITDATTEVGRHDAQVKGVLGVITRIRREVDVTTSNWPSGWQWFASDWLF